MLRAKIKSALLVPIAATALAAAVGGCAPQPYDVWADPEIIQINERYAAYAAKKVAIQDQWLAGYRGCVAQLESLQIGDPVTATEGLSCRPDKINITETGGGRVSQWVYDGVGYLYFRDGSLEGRQIVAFEPLSD